MNVFFSSCVLEKHHEQNAVNESTLILSEVQFSGRCIAKNVRLLKKPTKK